MFTENSAVKNQVYAFKDEEAGYKTNDYRIDKPLTVALDSMRSRITNMACQDIDRDIAAHLYAIACKLKALSNHLKTEPASDK